MKKITLGLFSTALLVGSLSASAQPVKSEKHAKKATELRQAVFQLVYSNMGPMGAMAKGKIPLDKARVEKNAMRINQLSYMISDYFKPDTRNFKVKTEALDNIWTDTALFDEKINALTVASANLQKVASSSDDEKAIKKAIGAVGKACGSCHDDFKKD